jgi:hypothetical protein
MVARKGSGSSGTLSQWTKSFENFFKSFAQLTLRQGLRNGGILAHRSPQGAKLHPRVMIPANVQPADVVAFNTRQEFVNHAAGLM